MMLRFFCVPQPGPVGDISYRYLVACRDTGYGIRAISILGGFIGFAGPWSRVSRLFAAPVSQPFINIVCAVPDLIRGAPLRATKKGGLFTQTDTDRLPGRGVPSHLDLAGDDDELIDVYQPQTAFRALLTVGCPNVAIVADASRPPSPSECEAIEAYDRIISPTPSMTDALRGMGLDVVHMEPDPDDIATLIDDLTK